MKVSGLFRLCILYSLIFCLWSGHYLVFQFPSWVDEIFLKPLLIGLPVLFVLYKVEKSSVPAIVGSRNITVQRVVLGVSLGIVLASGRLAVKFFLSHTAEMKVSVLPFNMVILTIMASITIGVLEEFIYRGYFFQRLQDIFHHEWPAAVGSSLLFVGNHLFRPIVIAHTWGMSLLLYTTQLTILGLIFVYVFSRTKSLLPTTIAYMIWNFSNALFV
jgi:membrane protease YdiL (CAAX protease family)